MALTDKRVDHLILLVGENPLPNAVIAALLLDRVKSIRLMHTSGPGGTREVAERLAKWYVMRGRVMSPEVDVALLGERSHAGARVTVQYCEIESAAEPKHVFDGLERILAGIAVGERVLLVYTGGTKVMAVHAYRALQYFAQQLGFRAEYCYLDADTLDLVFDPAEAVKPPDAKRFHLRNEPAAALGLPDFFALHDWRPAGDFTCQEPIFPCTAGSLAELHARGAEAHYREWKNHISAHRCGDILHLPKDDELKTFIATLRDELGKKAVVEGKPNPLAGHDLNIVATAQLLKYRASAISEWFTDKWLEHWAWHCMRAAQDQVVGENQNLIQTWWGAHANMPDDRCATEKTEPVDFELDVIAIIGYQLFVLSCGTTSDRGKLKLKLLEAAIRARQIGGDEARAALVCCTDGALRLQNELRGELNLDCRVFGRGHLVQLPAELKTWIESSRRGKP